MNSITDIRGRLKTIFNHHKLVFSMNNVVHMTGLSRNRLNYWQKRGYIHSVTHKRNSTRVYSYATLIKIELIKSYLNSGYTLDMATKKASQGEKYGAFIHDIVLARLRRIINLKGRLFADFGSVEKDNKRHVYFAKNDQGKIVAKVSSKNL